MSHIFAFVNRPPSKKERNSRTPRNCYRPANGWNSAEVFRKLVCERGEAPAQAERWPTRRAQVRVLPPLQSAAPVQVMASCGMVMRRQGPGQEERGRASCGVNAVASLSVCPGPQDTRLWPNLDVSRRGSVPVLRQTSRTPGGTKHCPCTAGVCPCEVRRIPEHRTFLDDREACDYYLI